MLALAIGIILFLASIVPIKFIKKTEPTKQITLYSALTVIRIIIMMLVIVVLKPFDFYEHITFVVLVVLFYIAILVLENVKIS